MRDRDEVEYKVLDRSSIKASPELHISSFIVRAKREYENKIFALLHNADMEPTITKIRTTTAASSVFQVLKDHANEALQSSVSTSNSYCFGRAAAELNREETVVEPTNPRSYPTKPCRIVVVNEDEHLTFATRVVS